MMSDGSMRKRKEKKKKRKANNRYSLDDYKVMEWFGEKIRNIRETDLEPDEQGDWGRDRVAGLIGVSETAIGNWERGDDFPTPAKLIQLSLILKTPLQKLLPGRLVQLKEWPPPVRMYPAEKEDDKKII